MLVTKVDTGVLTELLTRAADRELPTRVEAVVPLAKAAEAHKAVAQGGLRGKYVIQP